MFKKVSFLAAFAVAAFALQSMMAYAADDMDMDMDDADDVATLGYDDDASAAWSQDDEYQRPDGAPMMGGHRGGRHGGMGGMGMGGGMGMMGPGPRQGMCGPGMMGGGMGGGRHHRGERGGGMGMMGGKGMGKGMGMGMGMGMGRFNAPLMNALDLTDVQKNQMVDVLTEHFRNALRNRIEMADAMKKLRDLQKTDKPDGDAIIAANAAIGTARGKMEVLQRQLRDDVKNLLTPEQQKKLEDLRANFKGRFGQPDGRPGFGRGPGGPGPRGPRAPDAQNK